jgi:hypothetical protein
MTAVARPVSFGRLLMLALMAAGISACSSSSPPVPDMPTYAVDVKPILLAHCVRCHGAGGTLNADPSSSLPYPPPNGYFDHYEDLTDCTPGDGGVVPDTCKYGAASLAGAMKFYVNSDDTPMPPPPAPRLSAHDREVITRWADETPTPLP